MRYPKQLTDAVGNIIGNAMARGKEKEAVGFGNMAKLMRYSRETKGAMPANSDYRDRNFRKAVMARHAKADFLSKDRAKRAKRFYQDEM